MRIWMAVSLLLWLLTGCGSVEEAPENVEPERPPVVEEQYPIVSEIPSHTGVYVARAETYRTYITIEIREAATGAVWYFRLPDGSPIPEYLYLPEEWCIWTEENVARILVGEGGDAGEQVAYRCTVETVDGELTGTVIPAESLLADTYDFNHNGVAETLTIEGNAGENSSFWVLRLMEDGEIIWTDCAATAHAGWNNLFALEIDGQDYLLRYIPSMGQGMGSYFFSLFSLDAQGGEVPLRENLVSFDIWFDRPGFEGFDTVALAAFLAEVHGYLAESEVLFATQNSLPRSGGSGADFREDDFTGGLLTEREDYLAALTEYETACREAVLQTN